MRRTRRLPAMVLDLLYPFSRSSCQRFYQTLLIEHAFYASWSTYLRRKGVNPVLALGHGHIASMNMANMRRWQGLCWQRWGNQAR